MNKVMLLPQIPVSLPFSVTFCMKCPYRSKAGMERQPKMLHMDLIKNVGVYLLE